MPDSFLSILLVLAACAVVLFLPGAAWLAWDRSDRRDPMEWAAEAAGLSLALTVTLAAVFFWLGIHLSGVGLGLLYALALGVWLAPHFIRRQGWRVSSAGLAALALLLGLVAWRLYQARSLALPAWVDSVQHTLLVRLILENGGLPQTWQPYLPVPMYYHFGFHVITANFAALSQLEPAQAVLVFGQVLNATVALGVYKLAKVLTGDWRRAGLAALLVGFAFHMPAYYLTWGRYTLLAGLILLPLAIAEALNLFRGPASRTGLARLALYTAGICFTHYLVTGLLALFFLVVAVSEGLHLLKARRMAALRWQPFLGAALGVIVGSPWLLRVWQYGQGMASVKLADPFDPAQAGSIRDTLNYVYYLLGPTRDYVLMGLAAVGLVLALVRWGRGQAGGGELAVWGLLLVFLSTPYAPQFNPFRPDLVAIVLFLPASVFLADLVFTLGGWLGRIPVRFAAQAGLAFSILVSLGLTGWGVAETRDVLNSATVFTTPADVAALRWIDQNTPHEARFFVNSTVWQGSLFRGVDGGYWILPATGRFDLAVPIAIGFGAAPDIARYEDWASRASKITDCDDAFWKLVSDTNLTYVYVRQGAGGLTADTLDTCPGVQRVYAVDGVSIYKIK